MKRNFTLCGVAMLLCTAASAQTPISCNSNNCTTNSTIDQCPPGSTNVVTNFQNPVQKPGNPCPNGRCVNAVWRYTNVANVSGNQIDAEIKVIAISNAILDNIDDDGATDQAGVSIASFFGPRIGPDANLNASDRRGYVEFEVKFYAHTAPFFTMPQAMTGLNFVHYDIDGSASGSGWFRELGDLKAISATNPSIIGAAGTELTPDGAAPAGWRGFLGSTCERTGVSRCAQVAVSATYSGAQATVNFRMGYDFKATYNWGNPVRQYGARFGCFDFPGGGPLPVILNRFGASYKAGIATLNWESSYENNMKGYTIERSLDGINFDNTGFVGAKNQLGTASSYQFFDNISTVTQSTVFYRLHMTDLDGKAKYSGVVSVRKDKQTAGGKIVISPNPAVDAAQLRITMDKPGKGTAVISDATGRIVLQQSINVAAGSNSLLLNNLAKLNAGIYNVRVVVDETILSEKLIIRD